MGIRRLLGLVALLFISCDVNFETGNIEFEIINQSEVVVQLKPYDLRTGVNEFGTITIQPSDTYKTGKVRNERNDGSNSFGFFLFESDSIVLTFNNEKQLIYFCKVDSEPSGCDVPINLVLFSNPGSDLVSYEIT